MRTGPFDPACLGAPVYEPRHRHRAPRHPCGDVGDGETFQVSQRQGDPLILGQYCQGLRQLDQLLGSHLCLTGAGLLGGQQRHEPGRGLFKGRLQRTHSDPRVLAGDLGEFLRQDGPQPALDLATSFTAEASQVLMGLQECLLRDIRRVQLPTQPRIQVQRSQNPQVVAVLLQRARQPLVGVGHNAPISKNAPARKTHAPVKFFFREAATARGVHRPGRVGQDMVRVEGRPAIRTRRPRSSWASTLLA